MSITSRKKFRDLVAATMSPEAQQRAQAQAAREYKVLNQTDGHYCFDWDELPVSAWTLEYAACEDFKKSLRGRIINWFFVRWFYFRERWCRE